MTRASTILPATINVDPRPAGPADPGAAAPGGANGGGDGDRVLRRRSAPARVPPTRSRTFRRRRSRSKRWPACDRQHLHELGITTGRTPTAYDPTAAVTREQMAVFLTRLYTVLPAAP